MAELQRIEVIFGNEHGIFCFTRCAAMLLGWSFFYARVQGKKDQAEQNLSFALISNLSQPLNT